MANKIDCSQKLKRAAALFPVPLYLVGGAVRNALLGLPPGDWDVCASVPADEAAELFGKAGYRIAGIYPRMGTVKLEDDGSGEELEYTCFRTEIYEAGGGHTPASVRFTDDIAADARRRDFRMNAIYFDVAAGAVADPLGGLADLETRQIVCADLPRKVFGSDGLRLLRLVRFSAELRFSPAKETFEAAIEFRENVKDIARERIAGELKKICFADLRHPGLWEGAAEPAHAFGMRLLDRLGLLELILPELTRGRGLEQRKDFHRFDVFDHSIESFAASPPNVRIAALLHDVGKPVQFFEYGNFSEHEKAGAPVAEELGSRVFGLPKRECARLGTLVLLHMLDLDGGMRENKRKRLLARSAPLLDDLLDLKQADYLGCGLQTGECPTVSRWKALFARMRAAETPLSLRDLKVDGRDVAERLPALPKCEIGKVLDELWDRCIFDERLNDREKLLEFLDRRREGI